MSHGGWDVPRQAERVAARIPAGACVNLGIGMPTAVAAAIPPEKGVVLYCENGIINYRSVTSSSEVDRDIIDAGSNPVAMQPGAAVVGHDLSFALARGGRLDAVVLGAFQVSTGGDLANWKRPGRGIDAVGGAMDLAVGAKRVIIMMRHVDRSGGPKILEECTFPLTARDCVDTIVTDLAVLDITPNGLSVAEIADGVSFEELQAATGAPLRYTPDDTTAVAVDR